MMPIYYDMQCINFNLVQCSLFATYTTHSCPISFKNSVFSMVMNFHWLKCVMMMPHSITQIHVVTENLIEEGERERDRKCELFLVSNCTQDTVDQTIACVCVSCSLAVGVLLSRSVSFNQSTGFLPSYRVNCNSLKTCWFSYDMSRAVPSHAVPCFAMRYDAS